MKRNLPGIFAIVIAAGFSSFCLKSNTKVGEKWFVFNGDASTMEISEPDFYSLDNGTGIAPTKCAYNPIHKYRCEILIQPSALDATKPDLSKPIISEIGRSTRTP